MPEEAREYLGDWYDIAGPALGIAEPGERQADPQGVCDGLVAAVTPARPARLAARAAHRRRALGRPGDPALARRLRRAPRRTVRPGRRGPPARRGHRRGRPPSRPGRRQRPARSPRLSALTPEATAGLTRATLGEHADDPFCREVWAVTGGNPYETVELLAKVQDSGLDPVEALRRRTARPEPLGPRRRPRRPPGRARRRRHPVRLGRPPSSAPASPWTSRPGSPA